MMLETLNAFSFKNHFLHHKLTCTDKTVRMDTFAVCDQHTMNVMLQGAFGNGILSDLSVFSDDSELISEKIHSDHSERSCGMHPQSRRIIFLHRSWILDLFSWTLHIVTILTQKLKYIFLLILSEI
jgi:hypothetical protein